MKRILTLTLLAAATSSVANAQSGLDLGLSAGYASGLSGEAFLAAPNISGPFGFKFNVAYTKAADAINDDSDIGAGKFSTYKADGATEYGSHVLIGLDGTFSLGEVIPGADAVIYAGPRYSMFKGTEDYGTTGNTTYSSNSFGIGAGAQLSYLVSGNMSLFGDIGLDQYFKSRIDTTTVSGTVQEANINANVITATSTSTDSFETSEAGYDEISNRFVRPGTVFKARIGVKFNF